MAEVSSNLPGRIGILGGGSWATALAKIVLTRQPHLNWLLRTANHIKEFTRLKHNPSYLTSVTFDTSRITFFTDSDINDFFRACDTVILATPSPYIRYYLNGLLMQVEGNQLRLVATDGHRLAYAASQIEAELPKTEVILPRKTVLELFKLLNNPSESITVELLDNQVRFQCNGTTIVSKVIDGKFPDFNRVIPLDNDKIFLVSRTQLLGALERAAILANEKFRGARLFLQPGLLSVVCSNNEQEEAREELEIAYQGGELEVGFNIGYLMDVLRNIHSDDMQLAFGDANRSTLFTMPNNPNFKYIVMPMRI